MLYILEQMNINFNEFIDKKIDQMDDQEVSDEPELSMYQTISQVVVIPQHVADYHNSAKEEAQN